VDLVPTALRADHPRPGGGSLPDILVAVSPSIPSPSKLIKSATSAAVQLLGANRPSVGNQAEPVVMLTPPVPEHAPRAARVGKYDQALTSFVVRRPGVTVAQAAEELGVDPTALYPVIRRLEAHGQLVKRGRGLQPVLAGDGQSPKSRREIERLWCNQGHWWERARARGPKPKRCPDHR